MADINATDLTQETASTMDGNEQIIMFDSAEGKRATVKAVGDYIIQQVTSNLNGANQTLAAALSALNSNVKSLFTPDSYTSWKDLLTAAPLGVTACSASNINSELRPYPSEANGWGFVLIVKKNTSRMGVIWCAGSTSSQKFCVGHYSTSANNLIWFNYNGSIVSQS